MIHMAMVYGVLVGLGAGLLVIVIAVVAFVIRRWKRPKILPSALDLDLEHVPEQESSRSAPVTRSPSPHVEKKWFFSKEEKKAPLIRSLTDDMISSLKLPMEAVQPPAPEHKRPANSAQQYQQNLLGHMPCTDTGGREESRVESPEPKLTKDQAARLWFSLQYDNEESKLTVTLLRARNLKGRDNTSGTRDPFVKVYLLPDEKDCRQSRVLKKTLTPNFNDTFYFQVPPEEVNSRSLRMSMYDVDKRRVRHSLGHVVVPLMEMDLEESTVYSKELENASQGSIGLGDIHLSLMFSPPLEKLTVNILQARDLKTDHKEYKETYIRVQLYHGSKLHKSRKTSTHAKLTEPVFNEAVAFTIPSKQLESCSLIVSCMIPSNQPTADIEYGRVVLGSYLYARGEELHHWQEMVAKPHEGVDYWHTLADPNSTSVSSNEPCSILSNGI